MSKKPFTLGADVARALDEIVSINDSAIIREGDTWHTAEPQSRTVDETGIFPRKQVAAAVMIGGKKYYCSLVQLEPHATLERMEFMAFPVKKSGEIDFRGPVYERRFWRAENDWDVDAATWRHFVRFFAREQAKKEGALAE